MASSMAQTNKQTVPKNTTFLSELMMYLFTADFRLIYVIMKIDIFVEAICLSGEPGLARMLLSQVMHNV